MKKVLFLLAAVVAVYSMNDISKPYTFSPSELIRSSRINTNYDTAYNAINRNKDSIEVNFIRFKDLTGHDSTLKYLAVDTIRSNPNIDSIAGNTVFSGAPVIKSALTVDSINSTKNITAPGAKLTGLTSNCVPYQNSSGYLANSSIYTNGTNVAVGKSSIASWAGDYKALQIGGTSAIMAYGTEAAGGVHYTNNCYTTGTGFWKPFINGAAANFVNLGSSFAWRIDTGLTAETGYVPTVRMTLSVNGLLSPLGGIFTTKGTFSDSVKAVTGTFTGTVKVDSLNSTKGITTAGRLVGTDLEVTDSVKAVTGTFTGVVKVDSLNSTKGITTAGRLVGTDLEVTDSVKAVTGTFTGVVKVDSLNSTKGITTAGRLVGTDLEVTDSVKAATGTFTGTVKVDSLNSTKGITSSARVTATDLEASDSVKGVTGTFTGSISTDSIKFGAGNKITYLDTTFYDSLFDGTTYLTRKLVRVVQFGSLITLYQDNMSGTITASTTTTIKGIPSKFMFSSTTYPIVNVVENGASWNIGMVRLNSGTNYLIIQKNGTFLAAGTGGIQPCIIQWMIN